MLSLLILKGLIKTKKCLSLNKLLIHSQTLQWLRLGIKGGGGNFIPYFIMDVITNPDWDYTWSTETRYVTETEITIGNEIRINPSRSRIYHWHRATHKTLPISLKCLEIWVMLVSTSHESDDTWLYQNAKNKPQNKQSTPSHPRTPPHPPKNKKQENKKQTKNAELICKAISYWQHHLHKFFRSFCFISIANSLGIHDVFSRSLHDCFIGAEVNVAIVIKSSRSWITSFAWRHNETQQPTKPVHTS